jgi:hypothetical protein
MTVISKPAIQLQSRTIDGVSIRFDESELLRPTRHNAPPAAPEPVAPWLVAETEGL